MTSRGAPEARWTVDNPRGEVKGDPAAIAAEINAQIFHSRHPGLQMGAG